jgi:hypothetical protein
MANHDLMVMGIRYIYRSILFTFNLIKDLLWENYY